ncbi:unnamed protein product [Anisakis simplex]|uniref:Uncharacterized protein n=1 Tax=Anisakis simplex TaxID=6269 RepID=A0A0M3JX47_ANISI|nr:unnamed protein product [Anisakis simplex]
MHELLDLSLKGDKLSQEGVEVELGPLKLLEGREMMLCQAAKGGESAVKKWCENHHIMGQWSSRSGTSLPLLMTR